MAAAVDDGKIGTTNGDNNPSGKPTHGDQSLVRDHSRLREQLGEKFDDPDSPATEIKPGAPLAPPPVFFASGAPFTPADRNRDEASGRKPDLPAGDRRSRAFRWAQAEASRNQAAADLSARPTAPSATAVTESDPRPGHLTVVSGGETEESDGDTARNLSPSAAAALGDLVAAMIGPLAGGLAARSAGVFGFAALLVLLARGQARRSALTEREITGVSPVVAAFGVLAATLAIGPRLDVMHAFSVTGICLAAGAGAALIVNFLYERFVHTRIAVLGSATHAHDLAWHLAVEQNHRYTVVGYVGRDSAKENLRDLRHVSFKVRRLGLLTDLSHIVARHDIDLLVLAEGGDRLEVFERAAVCAERYRTRLTGLLAFEEAVFQRVALGQLNVAWMQHIMHPRFRPAPRFATRALDVTGAIVIGALSAPLWLFAVVAMRFGNRGPLLQRRRRVGERGRSFSIMMFRTTPPVPDDDPMEESTLPPTRMGRFLRQTHIDALPLLLNVLRGDMSLVGPRPASPRDVTRLEQDVPFYGRRHLVKPGITGWAQLHAKHDQSDSEHTATALTLSHDLFYLKHQSLFLYAYVLAASCFAALAGTLRLRAH